MNIDSNKINLNIHYHVVNEKTTMDALVHNECEKNLLLSIKKLQQFTENEIEIEVSSKKEGSVIAGYVIIVSILAAPYVKKIFNAFVANFFRPKSSLIEENISRVELIEKIKNGNFTQDQFDYIAAKDKDLMKLKSDFYKSASKDTTITQIETKVLNEIPIIINYNEFYINIIEKQETSKNKEILNATIYIVSPILVKIPNSKQKWKGIHQDKPIDFSILDKNFLEQVKNHEIHFENGTNIVGTLVITIKKTLEESGEDRIENIYSVKDILQWEDDKHFIYETKKYSKMKENERELKLFSNEEMSGI